MNLALESLFEYGHQANQELIDILIVNQVKASDKSIELMSHIINAEHIWISRMLNKKATFDVWQIHTMSNLKVYDKQNYQTLLSILSNNNGKELVNYKTTEGETHQNLLKDILFHLVNHGTYHRGQIAAECRACNIDPLVSDFIFYKRN